MTLFAIADRIEAKKAQTTDIEKKYIAPKDLKDAIFLQTQLTYEKTKDYPDLAELALRYKLPEVHFNRALEVEKQKKKFDNLPDIVIHGKDIDFTLENGASLKGYHLVKLPINDPRAYILGHIVNDCQSIGGHSDRCVIDGITRENNGFYVLLKEKNSAKQNAKIFTSNGEIDYNHFDIVGQAYAWLSKAGNLTLDSWENLRKEGKITKVLNDDEVIVPILQEFGKQVCETTTINRVTVGVGGITPKKFVEFKIKFPEVMLEGQEYVDANNQSLIWQKPELTGLEDEINKYITKVEYKFELNNINKGKALLNLLKRESKVEEAFSGAYKNQLCLLNFLVVNNDFKNFNYEYFKEFLDLDVITTRLLTSIKFLQGHKKGFFTIEDFKDFEYEKKKLIIDALINTQKGYENNYFTFNDIKDLDTDKIRCLTSYDAKEGYSKKYFTLNDLINLSTAEIELLTSSNAIKCYEKEYLNVSGLKCLSKTKIKLLTSSDAIKIYEKTILQVNILLLMILKI